jgi:hypothetical protein
MHKATEAFRHRMRGGIAEGGNAAAKIVPKQRKDLHDRTLMNKAEEIAAMAKTRPHCQ